MSELIESDRDGEEGLDARDSLDVLIRPRNSISWVFPEQVLRAATKLLSCFFPEFPFYFFSFFTERLVSCVNDDITNLGSVLVCQPKTYADQENVVP